MLNDASDTIEPPKRKLRNRRFRREATPVHSEHKEADTSSNSVEQSPSTNSRASSIDKHVTNGHVNENIFTTSETELKEFYHKTKKTLANAVSRGRERFTKKGKEFIKRSKSAPVDKRLETNNTDNVLDSEQLSSSLTKYLNDEKFQNTRIKNIKIIKPLKQHEKENHSKVEVLPPVKTRDILNFIKETSIVEFFRSFRNFCDSYAKHEYQKIKCLRRKCFVEIIVIMLVAGFGGLLFKLTEGTFESFYKCGVKRVKRDFIDLLWTKSHNLREDDWKFLARSKLRSFEEELHAAHDAGMTDYSGQRAWSFLNGVVYSITVLATIGYGHMFPKTNTGRALTIVYALIGIPLFLIVLTDFGKLLTRWIKFFWSFVRRFYYTKSCKRMRRRSFVEAQNIYDMLWNHEKGLDRSTPAGQDIETPTSPTISAFEIDDEFNLPISVALFILISYIFCGSVFYMVFEGWNFFESFYFVFVSMTTIGFGDYVPHNQIFMIVSIVYLIFGLALMSMCINVVQVKLSDTFKRASAKIGATMGLNINENSSVTLTPENIPTEIAAKILNDPEE